MKTCLKKLRSLLDEAENLSICGPHEFRKYVKQELSKELAPAKLKNLLDYIEGIDRELAVASKNSARLKFLGENSKYEIEAVDKKFWASYLDEGFVLGEWFLTFENAIDYLMELDAKCTKK